jgi:hypothetical protein
MFGFFIGTVCLIGLIKLARRGRYHGHWGHGVHGHGHHGHHGGRGGWGPRMMLRRLFERLDTTPGQEKVIVEAIDNFKREAGSARSEVFGARGEVASALRQDAFDEVLLGAALTRIDNTVDTLRKAALDAFGKVHAALDEKQRGILADIVEAGPRGFAAHPYRV